MNGLIQSPAKPRPVEYSYLKMKKDANGNCIVCYDKRTPSGPDDYDYSYEDIQEVFPVGKEQDALGRMDEIRKMPGYKDSGPNIVVHTA